MNRCASPLIIIFLLAPCLLVMGQQPARDSGKISGDVAISLRERRLVASLTYDYVAAEGDEPAVKFYLNGDFNVRKVKCRLCRSFDFDRRAKPEAALLIGLGEPLAKDERLAIEIDYEGNLRDIYKKEHEFLELGLDNFWFPVHSNIGAFNFTYRLRVTADEPGFQLVGNGRVEKRAKGWLVESREPDFDIDLVLGRNLGFKKYRRGGYNLQVVSKNLAGELPATLLGMMRETLEFYNSSFGSANPQRPQITAVIRPFPLIEGQGGYFRKGYFILPRRDDVRGYFPSVAHELAHYWWAGADQRNAWLNESFAEYSAMMAVRKLRGVQAYGKMLEEKRKGVAGLPPIYGFDRTQNRAQSPRVLYVKGPVKLSGLEVELGEEKFMSFLRAVATAGVKDTGQLIETLARVSSRAVADGFLRELKE